MFDANMSKRKKMKIDDGFDERGDGSNVVRSSSSSVVRFGKGSNLAGNVGIEHMNT